MTMVMMIIVRDVRDRPVQQKRGREVHIFDGYMMTMRVSECTLYMLVSRNRTHNFLIANQALKIQCDDFDESLGFLFN